MQTQTQTFPLGAHEFDLEVSERELFMPNAVTRLFAGAVKINPGDVVFDIGSGVGPLAIWSAKEPSSQVHAVEIVQPQYDLLRRNIESNGVGGKVTPYCGGFFDPLPRGLRANVIIADVSGIAEGPARALGWYPPEIPTGGDDGTGVIVPLLQQAGKYLAPGGRVYFPVAIGLSNHARTMQVAREHFGRLEETLRKPANFVLTADQVDSIRPYMDQPFIELKQKGSRAIWNGQIYEATEPISTPH